MRGPKRCLCALLILVGFVPPLQAEDDTGWNFWGRFSGSSNSSGLVLKADPSLGYKFSQYFSTYAGLPIYFVNESNTVTTSSGFLNGIGNAYVGVRLGVDHPAVNFASNLVLTAPTGDKDKGFSTGRATVDWTNSFNRRFSAVMPFASIGVANTVSDTSFFVRPFSSLGLVGHVEGGATISLSQFIDVGASAYGVRASGQQRIISKVLKHQSPTSPATSNPGSRGNGKNRVFETSAETVGPADIANDHGFSTWFGFSPRSRVDFQIGYTRSVSYDLDTLFFGVGFRFGK
ncbi:MAG TPA: hypothetical protein VE422_40635 [Terriglobia bacterium]|nr:hypothetical protein [Terriglobia bacterium]